MGFNSSFSVLGVGLPELVFIVMLALVVLGPERLPSVAKDLIRAFFKVRNLSKDLTGQLEAELGVAELKELKGIKTGKLIEDWANDELDLDFDEDDKDRKAAAQRKSQKPAAKPKAPVGAKDPQPVKKPPAKTDPMATEEQESSTGREAETAPAPNGAANRQRVESHNVIGSANSIGMHPGSTGPDMNGAAAESEPAASLEISSAQGTVAAESAFLSRKPDSLPTPMANGVVGPTMKRSARLDDAVPREKDRWQETMQRRRLLRIRNHGHPGRPDRKRLHPRIQRSQQRKQSPAFRPRAR